MSWKLIYERKARKAIRSIRDEAQIARLDRALISLRQDPRPPGAKKLAGYDDLWRIRVGDWRIVYTIRDAELVVLIVTVGPRRDVYDRL